MTTVPCAPGQSYEHAKRFSQVQDERQATPITYPTDARRWTAGGLWCGNQPTTFTHRRFAHGYSPADHGRLAYADAHLPACDSHPTAGYAHLAHADPHFPVADGYSPVGHGRVACADADLCILHTHLACTDNA
ncbi:MAG: hypothetical protein GTO49_01255 [Anaerolineae bacterium]|nr:hypothetical protein [Anaerolineae bacterium]